MVSLTDESARRGTRRFRKRSSRNFQASTSDSVVGEAEKVTVEEARKIRGSFWPEIRKRMLEKAIELYMKENFRNPYFYRSDAGSRRVEGKWILASCKILVLEEASRN